jgi:anti-anti-sigma factor
MPSLSVEVTQRQGPGGGLAQVVRLSGSLENDTVDKAEAALAPVLEKPFPTVVFNLLELSFVSSRGIGLFLDTKAKLEKKKVVVGVVGMRAPVKKAFDIVRALPATKVFTSVKEMDDYLAAIQKKTAEES